MKRILYLTLFIVSLSYILPSCEKEDEEEPKKYYIDPDKYHSEDDGTGKFYVVPND